MLSDLQTLHFYSLSFNQPMCFYLDPPVSIFGTDLGELGNIRCTYK